MNKNRQAHDHTRDTEIGEENRLILTTNIGDDDVGGLDISMQ